MGNYSQLRVAEDLSYCHRGSSDARIVVQCLCAKVFRYPRLDRSTLTMPFPPPVEADTWSTEHYQLVKGGNFILLFERKIILLYMQSSRSRLQCLELSVTNSECPWLAEADPTRGYTLPIRAGRILYDGSRGRIRVLRLAKDCGCIWLNSYKLSYPTQSAVRNSPSPQLRHLNL